MPRMIFVNLCVSDIKASTTFYTAIGGKLNPDYSNETVSCMVFSEAIHVMLMTSKPFKGFMAPSKTLADANVTSEVLLCLSADAKKEVDEIVEAAVKHGGKADPTVMPDIPGMYGRSFEDLDGHHWELMYMDESASKDNCPTETAKKAEGGSKDPAGVV